MATSNNDGLTSQSPETGGNDTKLNEMLPSESPVPKYEEEEEVSPEPVHTPRPKRKRKRKRYLKQLSSKVGIENGSFKSSIENGHVEVIGDSEKSTRNSTVTKPFLYCRFIARFPVLAFCKFIYVVL